MPSIMPHRVLVQAIRPVGMWALPWLVLSMMASAPCGAQEPAEPQYPAHAAGDLPTADGYRGIWYANQPSGDAYRFKYSGGLATYPQQHTPIAIHVRSEGKTFFVYGGRYRDRNRLLHMVSYFDHRSGMLARPRVLLDKQTDDAHDNPVLSIDAAGHLWVFSNAHGTSRPSYIHRSLKPYDITAFEQVLKTNFSYAQPWWLPEHGLVLLHTRYQGNRRLLHVMRSPDGRDWSQPVPLATMAAGHYQMSHAARGRIGTAFNYHPAGKGLNWRTNLYYLESLNGGATWQTVQGQPVEPPLTEPDHVARVADYEARGRLVYLKDMGFTPQGQPVLLYLTSGGYASGPDNGPRQLVVRHYTGSKWARHEVAETDNNYDFGTLDVQSARDWRIIAALGPGPQPFNTGGEIVMLTTADAGVTWHRRQLTTGSRFNHTYPRRPIDAAPDFYAMWADGHGRKPSDSRLYFCTREGKVFRTPQTIESDATHVMPIPLASNPSSTPGRSDESTR